jgi:hypothetical protein
MSPSMGLIIIEPPLEGALGIVPPRVAREVPDVVKIDGSIIIEPWVAELAA